MTETDIERGNIAFRLDALPTHMVKSFFAFNQVFTPEYHPSFKEASFVESCKEEKPTSVAFQRKTNSSLFLLLEFPTVQGGKMWVVENVWLLLCPSSP